MTARHVSIVSFKHAHKICTSFQGPSYKKALPFNIDLTNIIHCSMVTHDLSSVLKSFSVISRDCLPISLR